MTKTFTPAAADFPRADIVEAGDHNVLIAYPAFQYIHATNSDEKPICVDKGAAHLGEREPGVSVPFATRSHGMMHKNFGIGFYEGGDGGEAGQPFAYAKAVSITAEKSPCEVLAAANVGDTILLRGKRYTIRQTANNNIALDEA